MSKVRINRLSLAAKPQFNLWKLKETSTIYFHQLIQALRTNTPTVKMSSKTTNKRLFMINQEVKVAI